MKQVTMFMCDVCSWSDENAGHVASHEQLCIKQKQRQEKKRAEREATGQLTIAQIIKKCEGLPDLPVQISSGNSHRYEGMFVEDTDSYRGYYDELAIDVSKDKPKLLSSFISDMKYSLQRTFYGYKGGEYSMSPETFVWVAEYGDATELMVTDICLSPDGQVIHLCIKHQS